MLVAHGFNIEFINGDSKRRNNNVRRHQCVKKYGISNGADERKKQAENFLNVLSIFRENIRHQNHRSFYNWNLFLAFFIHSSNWTKWWALLMLIRISSLESFGRRKFYTALVQSGWSEGVGNLAEALSPSPRASRFLFLLWTSLFTRIGKFHLLITLSQTSNWKASCDAIAPTENCSKRAQKQQSEKN